MCVWMGGFSDCDVCFFLSSIWAVPLSSNFVTFVKLSLNVRRLSVKVPLKLYPKLPTTTNTHKNSEDQSDEQGFHGKASKSRPLTNSLSMRSSQRTYSISLSTSVNTRTNISWGDGGGERGSLCVCGWVVSQIVMLLFLKSIWRIAAPTWTSWP